MEVFFIDNNKNYAIFPLKMLSDDKYKDFSSKEFFLYMLLLNRLNISKSNLKHFSDKNGIFVYYTNKEITKQLRCDKTTSIKVLSRLENAGLIRKEYQKRGLPLKIYVNDIRAENNGAYSTFQKPQDKSLQKPYSNSIYNEKPHTDHSVKKEKQVSFDVELEEELAKSRLVDFSVKKQKRRTRNPGPTL